MRCWHSSGPLISQMVGGEGVAVKKKKRRGKRGVRKGKKQVRTVGSFLTHHTLLFHEHVLETQPQHLARGRTNSRYPSQQQLHTTGGKIYFVEIPNVSRLMLARRSLCSHEVEQLADSSTICSSGVSLISLLPALGRFVGPAQMEGFAGFPLAPGLGPEFAGQVRENNHSHQISRVGFEIVASIRCVW